MATGYTYTRSTIIAETPIPYQRFYHGLNLKKYLPSLWDDMTQQERICRHIMETRYKSAHDPDGWENVIFDSSNWHDDDDDDDEIIDHSEPQATFFNEA